MNSIAARHTYRENNRPGMTVSELPDKGCRPRRPLYLEWSADGTAEDWPGNTFAAIEMPAMISQMPAAFTPQPVPDADAGIGDPATATGLLQFDPNRWFTGPEQPR